MELKIHKVTPEEKYDLAKLFNAYRIFYQQKSDLEASLNFISKRIQNQDSVIFTGYNNNQLIGFTQLYPTFSSTRMKKFYILNDLYVEPKFRNLGYGKALLKYAQKFAREEGVKGLALETAIDNPAQFLYEELGWKKDLEFLHYFWEV